MFLKRIELQNFKSFAQKNTLEFSNSITAIVGPNGSGKSNVIDALRWVLGEQSLKNIRTDKGEDLIYSGNNKEKNANFASVSAVFDNQKNFFQLDYSEIGIIRKIDKGGISHYFLNDSPCRLKDVIEMIAKTKFGTKGMSIINQGAGDNILRVSPEERKAMLEEILGLKILEIKKEEARRKLERAILNLDKAQALYQELLPHLKSLKRQVNRWERKAQIKEELNTLEEKYFAQVFQDIKNYQQKDCSNSEEIKKKIKILEEEIKKEEIELTGFQKQGKKEINQEIISLTEEVISLQNKKSQLLRDLGRLEGQNVFKINSNNLEEKITKIIKKLEEVLKIENLVDIKKIIQEIYQILNTDILVSNNEKNNDIIKLTESQLFDLENNIEKQKKILNDLQNQVSEINKNFNQKFQQIEFKRKEKESLIYEINKVDIHQEKYELRMQEFKRRLEEAGRNFEEFCAFYDSNKDSFVILDITDFRFLESKIIRLRREIGEIGNIDSNILLEYEDLSNRCLFLTNQTEDLKNSVKDLRHLIKELNAQIIKELTISLKEINEAFNRYFQLLFKGGKAKLELIESNKKNTENTFNDINNDNKDDFHKTTDKEFLESKELSSFSLPIFGVEIKIDIPKTKLKSMEALSGGEKSLVAIALLFAIVNKSNPPLLIVDEIDAALDEENSRRFASILKELSTQTQFIVITHNRLTMEVAEIIYGVTINKDNCSQILSLKFNN